MECLYLTDEEKRMLDGEYGYGAQTGMKILVALGKVFDAEKLIPVRSAHVAGTGFKTFGKPGVAWLEDLVEKGAKVRIPTTLNVIGVDRATDLGFPRDLVEWQMRIDNAYEAMGAVPINCCTPYWCGYVPRMGESISHGDLFPCPLRMELCTPDGGEHLLERILGGGVYQLCAGCQR